MKLTRKAEALKQAVTEQCRERDADGRVQDLLDHPLMQAMNRSGLSKPQLRRFIDIRYNAASRFEDLLEHTLKRSEVEFAAQKTDGVEKKHLPRVAKALHRNYCDEVGWDPKTAKDSGLGSHSAWRKDFLDALGIKTGEGGYPLYQFHDNAELPVLAGMVLAAEMTIPKEDARLLKALRVKFPTLFSPKTGESTEAQDRATFYLKDHIEHDSERHLPELLEAIAHDFPSPHEQAQVLRGAKMFALERKGLFDHVQNEIGLVGAIR